MSKNWKDSLNFGEPTASSHKVGGRDTDFFPVSVGMMFKLRRLAGPIAKALAILTAGSSKDTGHIYRQVGEPITDENGKPILVGQGDNVSTIRDTETIAEAITPDLAAFRSRERQGAVEDLLVALTEEKSLATMADIIMDSLRMPKADRPPASEFFGPEGITTDLLPDLIAGVAKANKGVFGPLAEKLSPLFTQAQQVLEEKLSVENDAPDENDPEEPSEGQTDPNLTLAQEE